ncbi:MAG: hypothetical protein IPJ75_11760 [Ignavibacteriales bacterium]|nr:hypothetical protein [Ignavibacteriales bacterium]
MKIFDGNTFSTTNDFNGILPAFPDEGIYNPAILGSYIDSIAMETLSPDQSMRTGNQSPDLLML